MLENPDKGKTWGVRSKPGYYVGTSLDHYCYYWGWMRETKKIRRLDTVSFKHKYIKNLSITTGNAIVNSAQQLTSALRGSIPLPLVKIEIDYLRALPDIFNATKEGYDEQEKIKPNKTTAHSPRMPMGSPPPRVARDKNIPDLVPTYTSDSDNEGDKNESTQEEDIYHPERNTRSQSTILSIMDEVMLSCCQMSCTSYTHCTAWKYPPSTSQNWN